MKVSKEKDSNKTFWDPMKNSGVLGLGGNNNAQNRALPKLMLLLIFFVSSTYVVYTLKLLTSSKACKDDIFRYHDSKMSAFVQENGGNLTLSSYSSQNESFSEENISRIDFYPNGKTGLEHIVFGIAASSKLWSKRKNYIKIWWKHDLKMRGIVWLDSKVKTFKNESRLLPELRISEDTSKFAYKNKQGHRSAIRISRIVSETLRLGVEGVRWFVMGDDDTVFVTDNLVRVLNKYDHNQYYYIGSSSESHLQNIYFSYGMAYGGGGFAISYPLANSLVKMQDECIQRYPLLYGSDDRMQACMAELGVPLTREVGFHQYDVYGNLFGLLAAHPVAPLVSLHHLDVVEPIFPNVTRVEALQRLTIPMKLDSAGLMQQSICYDKDKSWTISVSWGFAIQVFRGVLSPREVEMPSRTFLNWYRRADYTAYSFNTRPVMRNICQKPFVFYMSKAKMNHSAEHTVSHYTRHRVPHPVCKWKMADPAELDLIEVHKKPDPRLWDRSPRRNCCRILSSTKKKMVVDVGLCSEGEISEITSQ
ncbi:glycosyltransferase [Lithospermum erythrorhizon]|uniref:Glycosyltransferase n=1 Tax=Lithospermum erythrorhizon TaxID=34254 RepID=A0AAV3RWG0_LITER